MHAHFDINIGATSKIHKKSNYDWNKLKLSIQHKYMYMYQEIYRFQTFIRYNHKEMVWVCMWCILHKALASTATLRHGSCSAF